MTGPELESREEPRTSGKWKLIALIVLLLLLAPASWLARRGAAKMDFFHLRAVTVEGTRFLTPELVLERLALDTTRSVWDDTAPLVEKLRLMSQVSEVSIRRKLPGTLVVTIRENLPVALVPSPRGLEAVDTAGVVLPIDPSREDLDLPVAAQRDKPLLSILGDLRGRQPLIYRRLNEIERDGRDGALLRLSSLQTIAAPDAQPSRVDSTGAAVARPSPSDLRVRIPLGVPVSRLADIFPVESDLLRRRANVAELDLRYRDQVIARLQ